MKDRIAVIYGLSNDASNFPDPTAITVDVNGAIGVRLFFQAGSVPLLGLADNSDVVTPSATANKLATITRLTAYDPTNNFYRRVSARATNALNALAPNAAEFTLDVAAFGLAFDGTNYHRTYTASAINLALESGEGVPLATGPGEWSVNHAPVAGTQATATRAASVTGQRHVCKGFSATLNAVAAVTVPVVVNVRDGASGAGAILWTERITAPVGTTFRIEKSGLNIVGSANTAMTIEFAAAPAGTDFQTVNLNGYTSG